MIKDKEIVIKLHLKKIKFTTRLFPIYSLTMPIVYMFFILFSVVNMNFSFGNEPIPCSSYISSDGHSFLLDSAYRAADLVVIGEVTYGTKTILKIKTKIKGNEKLNEIELTSNRCQGTACSGGFSVAPKIDLLFLLKRQVNGVYDSVTGNGNYSCPVVFEIEKESVKFRDKRILIRYLEKYFQTKPDPLPIY